MFDKVFKVCLLLVLVAGVFVYARRAGGERYTFHSDAEMFEVFDTHTGDIYATVDGQPKLAAVKLNLVTGKYSAVTVDNAELGRILKQAKVVLH